MGKTARVLVRMLFFYISFFSFIQQVKADEIRVPGDYKYGKLLIRNVILNWGDITGDVKLEVGNFNTCWMSTIVSTRAIIPVLTTTQKIHYKIPHGQLYDQRSAVNVPLPPFIENQPGDYQQWPIEGRLKYSDQEGGKNLLLFTITETELICPNDPRFQVDPARTQGNKIELTIRANRVR